MNTEELIRAAISLPIEERASLIDLLIKSMQPQEDEIEDKWITTAKNRLEDIKSGKVKTKPGDKVFEDIWNKFK